MGTFETEEQNVRNVLVNVPGTENNARYTTHEIVD